MSQDHNSNPPQEGAKTEISKAIPEHEPANSGQKTDDGWQNPQPPPSSGTAKPEPKKASPFDSGFKPDADHTGKAQALLSRIWTQFRRAFSINLKQPRLLAAEQKQLDALDPPIGSREFRSLLLWRKSLIYVTGWLIVPTLLLEAIKFIGRFDAINTQIEKFKGMGPMGKDAASLFESILGHQTVSFLLFFTTGIIFAIATWVAYRRWTAWNSSRKILLWAWVIYFISPFVMALIPVSALLAGEGGPMAKMASSVGTVYGLVVFLQLGPKALSLMPGVLRASIATKVLFPGSSSPGWLITLAAPLYALLFFVILSVPHQIGGGVALFLAIVGFVGAPLWLWKAGYRLAHPMDQETALKEVVRARVVYYIFNGFGLLFFLVAFAKIIDQGQWSGWDLAHLLLNFLTTMLILSVIVTDQLIRSLGVAKQITVEVSSTEPQQHYEISLWEFVDEQKRDLARSDKQAASKPASKPFG